MTYELTTMSNGEVLNIKCLICGMISYNLNDIYQKYCGKCHEFHEDKIQQND